MKLVKKGAEPKYVSITVLMSPLKISEIEAYVKSL